MASTRPNTLSGAPARHGSGDAAAGADLLVFDLDHDHGRDPRELHHLLGGKGAGLAEMHRSLRLPVPPGFVLGTPLCARVLATGWPPELDRAIAIRLAAVEQATGQRFGDPKRPLLVSVRSGAPVSMPGMMDTVLNLGVNPDTVEGLAELTGDRRFALDTWATFCRMYAATVLDVPRDALGPPPPRDAGIDTLRTAVDSLQRLCRSRGTPIPDAPNQQLRHAIEAVFRSWHSRRAGVYREREGIAASLGTAVVVQAMVFGNMGRTSGAGVAFSRDPSTGVNKPCGDFLLDAQGEDVVAGTHATEGLAAMAANLPVAHAELLDVLRRLEAHYRDLCDVEFTVQNGSLYLLQARAGKRSAVAAARMAVEMAADPHIRLSREEAVRRVSRDQIRQLQSLARVKPGAVPTASGVAASPGVAVGVVCTDPDKVGALAGAGASVILVRPTLSPEDAQGMMAAAGMVTASGGMLCHAALVARSWGIPAICGVAGIEHRGLADGELVTIDGERGAIYRGDQHEPGHAEPSELCVLREWAAELGMELAAEPCPTPEAPREARAVSRLELLRALQLRGFAAIEQLAEALLTSVETVGAALAGLEEGLVDSAPRGLHVTAAGRQWLTSALAEERQRLDPRELDGIYTAFMSHDVLLKGAVTDWQVRLVDGKRVPNDHDAAYDAAVLARIAALHDQARPLCVRAAEAVPRLERYGARLSQAAGRIAAGDATFIASPLKDSYHTIWFELHEELIGLCGRTRLAEEQRQA